MLLHLARHFCFDHYRSFRAFSWITGVLVMWLVYASGVNGYMLPWDRLAQFVLTATAEWFDALPPFRGVLVRNFVFPEAITDRFFTLPVPAHWHPARGARGAVGAHPARPARENAAAALDHDREHRHAGRPVAPRRPSQPGKADLAAYPQSLEFDWFYLAVYPSSTAGRR
jgi:hypothetical protein